jgi:MFS family permease
MANQELIDYIKGRLNEGVSKEEIKNSLLGAGWKEEDINDAFFFVSNKNQDVVNSSLNNQSQSFAEKQPQDSYEQKNENSIFPKSKEILKQAIAIYKERFKTFFGINLIASLVSISIIYGMILIGKLIDRDYLALFLFWLTISNLIAIIIIALSQLALAYVIKDYDEKIGIIEAYKKAFNKATSFLWIMILTSIVTMLGLILFIIPGIIFAVWFSFASYVLITEDLKGVKALSKSKEYVSQNFWKVFSRIFYIFLIYFVIYLIPKLLFDAILKMPLIYQIINFGLAAILTPLLVIYGFLLYTKVKALKTQ